MPNRIVHIGFPKTATTFLQKSVFPYIHGVNYVDYHTSVEILSPLIYLDELDYNGDTIQAELDDCCKQGINLFSFEGLCGAPFIYKGLGRSWIPKRLRYLGFSKVIITIRDQVSVIDSLYRQYILQGGVMRFNDFLNKDGKWNLYTRSFNLEYLNYFKLISLYKSEFGDSNVLVLTHENLLKNEQNFVSRIVEFIQPKQESIDFSREKNNTSLSNLSINLLRIVNHFIFTSQKPNHLIWNKISTKYVSKIFKAILDPYFLRFFSSRKSYVNGENIGFIQDYYAKSNQQLDENEKAK